MPLSSAASTLIGSGLDFMSSLGSGLFNLNQAKINRQFQERMYDKQVQDNINFWNMNNQYNLPSAVKQRLEDAGLNPLLMYSNGGTSLTSQSMPQSGNAPSGDSARADFRSNFTQAINQAALLDAQKRNVEADTQTKLANSILSMRQAVKSKSETRLIDQQTKYEVSSMEDRLLKLKAENRLSDELAKTEKSKRDEITAHIDEARTQIDYLENEMFNKNRITDQEIKESETRIENSIKETAAAVAKMNAEARKAYADTVYVNALTETEDRTRNVKVAKLRAELNKAIKEGTAQDIENAMNNYIYSMRPKPGSAGYKFRKWIETWVNPVTEGLGKILGGSATYSFGRKPK